MILAQDVREIIPSQFFLLSKSSSSPSKEIILPVGMLSVKVSQSSRIYVAFKHENHFCYESNRAICVLIKRRNLEVRVIRLGFIKSSHIMMSKWSRAQQENLVVLRTLLRMEVHNWRDSCKEGLKPKKKLNFYTL